MGNVNREFTMSVEVMICSICGKPATEYDEGKWKCLNCGLKFIYEKPPTSDKKEISISHTTKSDRFISR